MANDCGFQIKHYFATEDDAEIYKTQLQIGRLAAHSSVAECVFEKVVDPKTIEVMFDGNTDIRCLMSRDYGDLLKSPMSHGLLTCRQVGSKWHEVALYECYRFVHSFSQNRKTDELNVRTLKWQGKFFTLKNSRVQRLSHQGRVGKWRSFVQPTPWYDEFNCNPDDDFARLTHLPVKKK